MRQVPTRELIWDLFCCAKVEDFVQFGVISIYTVKYMYHFQKWYCGSSSFFITWTAVCTEVW